jgi:hypothetical protein
MHVMSIDPEWILRVFAMGSPGTEVLTWVRGGVRNAPEQRPKLPVYLVRADDALSEMFVAGVERPTTLRHPQMPRQG